MKRPDQIRTEILFVLYAVRPTALTPSAIAREARKNRLDYGEREVAQECQFLADNGLLIAIQTGLSTEQIYRIHAKGVTEFEQNHAP